MIPIEIQIDYKYLYGQACKERDAYMKQYINLVETVNTKIQYLQNQNKQLKNSIEKYEKQLSMF